MHTLCSLAWLPSTTESNRRLQGLVKKSIAYRIPNCMLVLGETQKDTLLAIEIGYTNNNWFCPYHSRSWKSKKMGGGQIVSNSSHRYGLCCNSPCGTRKHLIYQIFNPGDWWLPIWWHTPLMTPSKTTVHAIHHITFQQKWNHLDIIFITCIKNMNNSLCSCPNPSIFFV